MKYCPHCKRDFEDTVAVCHWCEVELVDELADEKAENEEKLRRELMPTEEELQEEQADFFGENAETVTVYTDYDPLQIRDIEAALKEKGIPVLVRLAVPEGELGDNEPAEETVEEPAEEIAEEPVADVTEDVAEVTTEPVEEKKGFFARLFGKKAQADSDPVVGQKVTPFAKHSSGRVFRSSDMLDVVVPAALAEEAVAAVNGVLGIYAETEVTHYTEEELDAFDRETMPLADGDLEEIPQDVLPEE